LTWLGCRPKKTCSSAPLLFRSYWSAFIVRVPARAGTRGSGFPVLPLDTEAARVHAQLHAAQLDAGSRSGAHDLLIAATAVAHGFAVLTRDVDDFSRVPGLAVLAATPLD